MSYYDDVYTGGAKSDDDEDVNNSDSEVDDDDDDDEEIVVNEEGGEEVEEVVEDDDDLEEEGEDLEEDDDDDLAKGKDDSEGEDNEGDEDLEEGEIPVKKVKKALKKTIVNKSFIENLSDDDDDDADGETYLKKFDNEINDNYIVNNHPECVLQNYDEILAMTKVVRDKNNIIVDDLHRTIPHLTKYERARILGQRAKQIETGATPFIKVPENVIDGYLIAVLELQQGRIPFIIRRPMPNGGSEYWKINDLENIAF